MLMQRLGIPFKCESPDIDESAASDEKPDLLVQRLAELKTSCIAKQYKDAIIVGSDQIATYDHFILNKPGNHENARIQLSKLSGVLNRNRQRDKHNADHDEMNYNL